MSLHWPANADSASAWAHQTWSDLAARPDKARVLVILPVHGFADHGFGLPLNTEEIVGSALLRSAVAASGLATQILVLPPFTFGAAPYAHTHFGTDTDTALDALGELLSSIKASGFTRILLFNTSPWNTEITGTAALDARSALDLRTYVIGSSGLGLGFHPEDPKRARTQAVAALLFGREPSPTATLADVRDTDFRPGFYAHPHPVTSDPYLDGERLFNEAATQLAGLLQEISAHGSELPPATRLSSVPRHSLLASCPGTTRLLTALTTEELAALPDKARALVILPTGAIEQHGHHLPVGTDTLLGRLWLAHALPKLPADAPVYVAPALVYGKSNEHLGFAGTLTISARTLRRQLLAQAAHLKALGFRQLAVLNTHGGNSAILVATLREIQTTLGLRAGMLSGYYRPQLSPQETAFGFHAGEWETSLLLAGAPELVRMDRAVCEYPARIDAPGVLRPEASAAVFAWKTTDISRSGVMGDATQATAEKGARWLDEASAALTRKIETLLG
ncbi:MAG: creatininase family protein [Rariglobus sp.]|nr:creatininase family protein [Rariglobus sp.]